MSRLYKPVLVIPSLIQPDGVLPYQSFVWTKPESIAANYPGSPDTTDAAYKWIIKLGGGSVGPVNIVMEQNHSSAYTRYPGKYTAMDLKVGQWMAEPGEGKTLKIIGILEKTDSTATVIAEDVFFYNIMKNPDQNSQFTPGAGEVWFIFETGDDGSPIIDPTPISGTIYFWENIVSRFKYYNTTTNYPLLKNNNDFAVGDVIAVDTTNHTFVKADNTNKTVIGRVTLTITNEPGVFTINPVQKIVDNLDYLPGNVGDTIYSSTTIPGAITTDSSGAPLYIKLANNGISQTKSVTNASVSSDGAIIINGVIIPVSPGSMSATATYLNSFATDTGVQVQVGPQDNIVSSDGFPSFLTVSQANSAQATINGVLVTFNVAMTFNQQNQAFAADMTVSINNANIPNILAYLDFDPVLQTNVIKLRNTTGGAITIVNVRPDSTGRNFAGPGSASKLPLLTSATSQQCIVFSALDSRAIDIADLQGTIIQTELQVPSVENAKKAVGLYIESVAGGGGGGGGSVVEVVADLAALNALTKSSGKQAYVINSADANGNNVDEWSTWIYNGSTWVKTSSQDSSQVDARSIEYVVPFNAAQNLTIGKLSTGRRITLITVDVTQAFVGGVVDLTIGYSIPTATPPVSEPEGLMTTALIDLSRTGIYTATSDILFGSDTPTGDVTLTATYTAGGSTAGSAKIIVTYV